MYTIEDYKTDGKALLLLQREYNRNSLNFKEHECTGKKMIKLQARLNKFAVKHFVGKYLKYKEYKFSCTGAISQVIVHYFHPTKLIEFTSNNSKIQALACHNRITPFCDINPTKGKYYANTGCQCIFGIYCEEITDKEWKKVQAKIVNQKEYGNILSVHNIINGAAFSYVKKHQTKEEKKLYALQNKLLHAYQKASKTYNNLIFKHAQTEKQKITVTDFERIKNDLQTYGYYAVIGKLPKYDSIFESVSKKKTTKSKKK